jgi:hypothetical protein
MLRTFGRRWMPGSKLVETPVGRGCLHCKERVAEGDEGMLMPYVGEDGVVIIVPVHRECFLRSVFGSVGHQQGKCSCHGGTETDPPGVTKRDAAWQAVFYATGRKPN